jgi:hypothetical protein
VNPKVRQESSGHSEYITAPVLVHLRKIKARCRHTPLCCDMATVLYRCPDTGLNVQGWLADDGAAN